jgi:hypothetical protein
MSGMFLLEHHWYSCLVSPVGWHSVFWAALSKWQALSLLLYVSQQLSIDKYSEK